MEGCFALLAISDFQGIACPIQDSIRTLDFGNRFTKLQREEKYVQRPELLKQSYLVIFEPADDATCKHLVTCFHIAKKFMVGPGGEGPLFDVAPGLVSRNQYCCVAPPIQVRGIWDSW